MRISCLAFLGFFGCTLDSGENRRSEILPGRYQAANENGRAVYEFRSDGTFSFQRYDSAQLTITEEGKWLYRYLNPDTRYLDEIEVTRKDLASTGTWNTQDHLNYSYTIDASSEDEFVLNPGSVDGPGILVLVSLFSDTDVHFIRQ